MSIRDEPPSKRQQAILDFLDLHIQVHGYPPSVREIGEAVDLVSPSSVAYQLKELCRKGRIEQDPRRPRALRLVVEGDACAKCGRPFETAEVG